MIKSGPCLSNSSCEFVIHCGANKGFLHCSNIVHCFSSVVVFQIINLCLGHEALVALLLHPVPDILDSLGEGCIIEEGSSRTISHGFLHQKFSISHFQELIHVISFEVVVVYQGTSLVASFKLANFFRHLASCVCGLDNTDSLGSCLCYFCPRRFLHHDPLLADSSPRRSREEAVKLSSVVLLALQGGEDSFTMTLSS